LKNFNTVFSLLSFAYSTILRDLLVKAVSDPAETWDEVVLDMVDRVFNYEPKTKASSPVKK